MRAGRVVGLVVGAILGLLGLGLAIGAGALLVGHATMRGDDGFYQTSPERIETSTAALVAGYDVRGADAAIDRLGTLRVRAASTATDGLFIGLAPASDVRAWLSGVAYTRVLDAGIGPFAVRTERVAGPDDAARPPTTATFWAASATGAGTQSLTWRVEPGEWTVVVMNADGRPGIAADVSAGVQTDLLLPVGLAVGGVGAVLLLVGLVVTVVVLTSDRSAPAPAPVSGRPGAYPVRLDGHLDPELSRWRWLVKWILAIPHLIVLSLLWIAVVFLTLVAGVAILFTGVYPRRVFDFNVGVMRWTWRVAYYAFSAMGTDRYPPFSLDPDAGYPADFSVDYPARLSRGLVLVKWWLLAIPHYIVVAFFAGGWSAGWSGDDAAYAGGAGLIGLLALIAVVVLLFTGGYPRPVFDFVMGMNRWCYRVLAYAFLMRDEYPPFRLDNGGTDPGSVPVPPPVPPDRSTELVGATGQR